MSADGPDHRLPPRREQLPLPRRDGQTHLEPQLRERDGAGSGTPFEAFDDEHVRAADPTPSSPASAPPSGSRAATFRAAVRKATGRPS
ncbi:hypothetical protein [Pseudonocardia broussonetiae]|uniref:Uncharacterized protein n=1 Tax=Pseudonocardia broussonetiae TaxID=2736640 RepID=A0A6M6JQ86_9PSEU|nr:hypothetical protein [Pseudonocardia broussonetiae]QJY48451.1 hypothetical protein HOP40_23885 [Pseudonocardia broussonetiae]